MTTTYPADYDSDLEIPRIEQNVSEISGDVINSLRDATFAIQTTMGINPQGNKASLTDRINVSIDANGYIKSASLENIGLLALPVVDRHVGLNAGIQESKLDLEYGTRYLKNLIDSMRTDLNGIVSGLSDLTARFNLHTLGRGYHHDGYHIKINLGTEVGVAGLEATTVGDAINELSARLLAGSDDYVSHINLDLPSSVKHQASEVSVDTTGFITIDRSSQNVQEAFESLDEQSGALGVAHVDQFHANGVLKEINSGNTYNSRYPRTDLISGVSYSAGTSVVTLPGITSFASMGIKTGDILVIPTQGSIADAGNYQIRAVGPLADSDTLGELPTLNSDQLAVFYVFSETVETADSVKARVYRPEAVSSEKAPLACAVRNNETIVDTITIMNPNSAKVVSEGFNGAILGADGYEIGVKIGLGNQEYRELIIPGLHLERLGTNMAELATAESVAERINAYVSDPDLGHHFPISAFKIGDELAIAHNWVGEEYTLEITDGYTGNYPLGLDAYGSDVVGQEIIGNTNVTYSVNGTSLSSIRTVFEGTATITSDTSSFSLYDSDGQMINPLEYGIGAGSVLHVMGHPTADTNGSYTLFTSNSTSVSLFSAETIDAPESSTTFNVKFTDSNVSLAVLEGTQTDQGLMQLYVDSEGRVFPHQRLIYGDDLGAAFEIVQVTERFPVEQVSVLISLDGSFVRFNILDTSLYGKTVTIHEDFQGKLKLYHPNGVDYLVVNILPGGISGVIEVITVNDPVPADQALLLCTAHFNGTLSVTSLIDERLFGNLAADQIRDDFITMFSQQPVADLRSDGVAEGFDIMDIPYYDSVTDMQALPLRGGVAYINGVRASVESQKVIIRSFDEFGDKINSDKIVGIDDTGSIQVFDDALSEMLTDGYNSSATFGKILPLYKITVSNGDLGCIIDLRRFINNLDERLDTIVDETNNIVGNFRSLEGALLYAANYPGKERLTIRIINSVAPVNPITVPDGVSLVGGAPYGGDNKHQIINHYNHVSGFITLEGNNRVENLDIVSDTVGLQGALLTASGPNVDIDKCLLRFIGTISSNSNDRGVNITSRTDVRVTNTKIDNVYIGISCEDGCDNLWITGNHITGVSGVGSPISAPTSSGIRLGSETRSFENGTIINNIIEIETTANTDLRGINVDVGESIGILRISGNKIMGELDNLDENHFTNGVRVANESDTGNTIGQLILLDNYIENVRMHDNQVYAIYVEDVNRVLIANNVISNAAVFDTNYGDTACIWINDNVETLDINNNVLTGGGALRGIYVYSTDTLTSITGNTINQIGSAGNTDPANPFSVYVYGNAHRANVSDNKLIGPGDYGIFWKGERSKISSNHLSTPDPSTDYAFKIGIKFQASYIDIMNNMIMDMTDEESVGIVNHNTANEGAKISGNTIEGDTMVNLVKLKGNYHVISGNRFKNDTKATAEDTYFVEFDSNIESVSISGNIFEGKGTAFIHSSNTISGLSILNNTMLAVDTSILTEAPIRLTNSSVSDCMVAGNIMPPKSDASNDYYSLENVIGVTPSQFVYNQNTIGINRGLLDNISVHAAGAISGYDSNVATEAHSHWAFNDTAAYWELNTTISDACMLYFPINGLPNGATLKSIHIQGKLGSQGASPTIAAQIYKRSVNKADAASPIQAVSAELSITATGEFVNTTSTGLVDEHPTNPGEEIFEVINYAESAYYLQIKYTCANTTDPSNVQIRGITINFRY